MEIKVLGTGCPKCKSLYQEAEKAVVESGIAASLTKVEKIEEILDHGVMMTPALVVNGEVKSVGKVVRAPQIVAWMKEEAAKA